MTLLSKLYKIYRYRIYYHIKNTRGSTRLLGVLNRLAEKGLETPDNPPQSIFDFEWDNLIVIDACRHDLYEEVNGSTQKRASLSSCSAGFIRETFTSERKDIVYITSNPHFHSSEFSKLTKFESAEDVFHTVFHTYKTDWNEKHGTVLPEPVVRDALLAEKLFPEKRKIIHFMQPHHPFINSDLDVSGIDQNLSDELKDNVWGMAEQDLLEKEVVWEAYKGNLEYVMPYCHQLAEALEGVTTITADHGNFVGENGIYHHPCGCKTKPVREVPWDQL